MARAQFILAALFTALAGSAFAQAPATPAPPKGDAAQIVQILDQFCTPALKGGSLDQLAAKLGMRKNRDGDFILSMGGPKHIAVTPPNPSNPTVCSMTVVFDLNAGDAIYDALNAWGQTHPTPYAPGRTKETSTVGDETHITSTWSAVEADGDEGLVFIQDRNHDGKPLNNRVDQGSVLYSIRPN